MAKSKKVAKKKVVKSSRGEYNFIHLRGMFPSMTVALEHPSASQVKTLAQSYLKDPYAKDAKVFWNLRAGATFLHKNDQYNKEIGRNEAKAKVVSHKLEVLGVRLTKTHVFVDLSSLVFTVKSKDNPVKVVQQESFDVSLRLNKKTNYATTTFTLPRAHYEEQSAYAEYQRRQRKFENYIEKTYGGRK